MSTAQPGDPHGNGHPTPRKPAVPAPLAETLPPSSPSEPPGEAATLPPRPTGDAATEGEPGSGTLAAPAERDEAARVVIPGYEVLGELGRGGMGVVYKARQTRLNRLVALKMILSGAHAGSDERQRFLREAEAVARLQHPNIVQIHEVGEHQGLPFFSLEFCAGGSLAGKLRGSALPDREAAALVAALARGMHTAHQKGIVHRDLKPANVLLAEDGTPKVTDFGLAKQLDQGGQTATGAVLGTPSYMAPEQAGGHSKEIGTLSDVYALGAILYECLTGQPPHTGATPMEILLRLLDQDPVPPRERNPRVDHDLEAVCLKCLARNPAERYGSAADLAADLESWRAGEPTSIRTSALADQFRAWLRQNLRSAGRTLAIGLACGLLVGVLVWVELNEYFVSIATVYDRLPSAPRPWLAHLAPALPHWCTWAAGGLAGVILGGMGFVTAVLVRPGTRHAAVAAGLAVGCITAVTAFALSIGWGPLTDTTIGPIQEDLWVLSEAAFTRAGPGEPHPSDRLLFKYPDLEKVPERERAAVLYGKVLGDLASGLLPGLWWGMFAALVTCVVPSVVGTVAAAGLLRRHASAWRALPPYGELAVTLTALMGLIAWYVIGPLTGASIVRPEAGWLAAILLGPALGVAVLWRHWRALARLPVHAGWLAVLALFSAHEVDQQALPGRAVQLVQAGDFRQAAELFGQTLRRQPGLDYTRFQAAVVCLQAGDREGYRRHCRELLARARRSSDPQRADQAAKVCLLGGDADPDQAEAVELAERAARLGAGDPGLGHWFQLCRGMAAYRAGRHAEALTWLHKCQAGNNVYSASTALVFEAMSLQHLGRSDEARAALGRADAGERNLEKQLAGSPQGPLGPGWADVLIFRIARREAEQVVNLPTAETR